MTPSLEEINGALNTRALRGLPLYSSAFEYWLLLVVLWCYAVAGAPEVPLGAISLKQRSDT